MTQRLPPINTGSILIIDDKPDFREQFAAILSKEAYVLQQIPPHPSLVEYLEANPPNLIVINLQLSQGNAYELCQSIKKNPKVAHIPVIFINSDLNRWNKDQAFAVGCTGYLTVPLHPHEVRQRIKSQLLLNAQDMGTELRNNAEIYAHFYHYTPIMSHCLDLQGKIQAVSDYWLTTLGYQREEVIGQRLSAFLSPKSRFYFEKVDLPLIFQDKETQPFSYQVISRNQLLIEVIFNWTVQKAVNPNFSRVYGVMIDITQPKQIERSLRQSTVQLQTIVNTTTDGLLIVDHQGIVRFANPSAAYLLNQPLEDLINYHFGLPIVINQTAEIEIIHRESEIGIGEMSVAETEWEGQPVHIVSIRDITERQRTAFDLKAHKEQLQAVFQQAAVGLALIQAHGQLIEVNQRLCSIIGYNKAELLSQNIWEMTYPEDRRKEEEKLSDLFTGKIKTFSQEKRLIKPDGSIRWVNMAVSLASDLRNNPYFIGVIEDIHEQKQIEENLQKYLIRQNQTAKIIDNIRRTLDLSYIFKITTQELRQLLHCNCVVIYRFNPEGRGLSIAESKDEEGSVGLNKAIDPIYDVHSLEFLGDLCRDHQTYSVADIYTSPRQPRYLSRLEQFPARAYLMTPVFVGETQWGLLSAYEIRGVRQWEEEELQIISQIATQLGIAIQQGELLEKIKETSQALLKTSASVEAEIRRQLKQQSKTAKAVDTVVDKIREVLDVRTIFDTATREARNLLNVDRVVVYQFNSDWTGQFLAESRKKELNSLVKAQKNYPSFSNNISECHLKKLNIQVGSSQHLSQQNFDDPYLNTKKGQKIRQKAYFMAHDIYEMGFSPCYLQVLEQYCVRAYLISPVIQGGELWGLLAAYEIEQPRQWEQWEIDAIVRLGDQLGIALQQAEYVLQIQQKSQELIAAIQAESQMRQAKEAADSANQAKSEFLAKMSHELRTPLNAILGFAQILMNNEDLTETQQDYLQIINNSGEHLLGLINDILEMSKIEAGRVALKETAFDLYHLLYTLKEMFALKAASKGLDLIFNCPNGLPQCITTDESKLRQVLINLLSNAIKFTETGKITLTVALGDEISALNIRFLVFSVEDTGPGINPHEAEMLFDPFGQTEIGRQMQQGTGLGLPISQKFVQLMGGELLFTSPIDINLQQGVRFKFNIPVKLMTVCLECSPQPIKRVVGLASHQPTYRILVVEDNAENRRLLVEVLSRVDFTVKAVENGEEAVRTWQEWQPHLIWMDISMPVMDGYTATRQIRSYAQGKKTIIVALTASAFEEERNRILAAGCNEVIRKPLQIPLIYNTMAHYLGVKYIYRSDTLTNLHQEVLKPIISDLTAADFQQMPRSWLRKLHRAACELDEDAILQLIEAIPPQEIHLINGLRSLSQKLRFDQLIELIK